MLKKLSKVYANADNLKLVAQRGRQAIIDTKEFENAMYYIIVDASKCSLYSTQWYIKRKQVRLGFSSVLRSPRSLLS